MKKICGVVGMLCLMWAAGAWSAEAAGRLDRVLRDKVIRVGVPGDYRPFAMLLPDGKYEGHDIDVVELMAGNLGVKAEYVKTSWPTLMEDYLKDKFDLALGGISINAARMIEADFLPPFGPGGKVALIRAEDKDRFSTPESLNREDVRVIKNPGGTNEKYVDAHLTKSRVTMHEKNAEIPGMIAEGKGDVMITDTYEALLYSREDKRLYAAFVDAPLTPLSFKGFMLQKDDPDFVRVMRFLWDELRLRGDLERCGNLWLK